MKQKLSNTPDLLNRLLRKPSPNDPNVKPTGDGNYRISIQDTQGNKQEIVTLGDEFLFGSVANALRKFPDAKNQRAFYAALHRHIPEQYKRLKKLPLPSALGNRAPSPSSNGGILLSRFLRICGWL